MKNCEPALSGFPGTSTAGDRSARHLRRARFRLHHVQPAGAIQCAFRRIPGQRIAALDHPVFHDAVKHRPVVAAVTGELHEMRHLIRRRLRREIDDERAGGRVDDGLFRRRAHLWGGAFPPSLGSDETELRRGSPKRLWREGGSPADAGLKGPRHKEDDDDCDDALHGLHIMRLAPAHR
jgi:hypothetical protein